MSLPDKTAAPKVSNGANDPGVGSPHKGDRYRCAACGMALEVTADCHCKQGEAVHFHCCGQELQKA